MKYKNSKIQKLYNLKTEFDLLKILNFKAKNDIKYLNNAIIRETNELIFFYLIFKI